MDPYTFLVMLVSLLFGYLNVILHLIEPLAFCLKVFYFLRPDGISVVEDRVVGPIGPIIVNSHVLLSYWQHLSPFYFDTDLFA